MKSTSIANNLFVRNREKLAGLMDPGSMALLHSADRMPRNGDQFYPYRQSSDLYYLTGINQEDSVLIFFPDHSDPGLREILFIKKSTIKSELWSGPTLTHKEAGLLSGISEIRSLEDLDAFLELLIPGASVLYNGKGDSLKSGQKTSSISPLLTQLRMVKEYEEIEEIKKASRITHSAFLRVLKTVKPGMMEYELEAEIIGEFIRRGARGHAYDPIVASGRNALVLHYLHNHSPCRNGELILMDFGAELNNYAADCSRTIPVNGRFSRRQLELYEAVLRVFKQARDMMQPGKIMIEFHNEVGKLWEEEHVRLGLYTKEEIIKHSDSEPLWKIYFMHGTTHSLGLDVHDPFDRSLPFSPGMVLTCEPAIYIPEEGIGIRLENDILITGEGPVDLLEDIPIEAAHIEELMGTP